MRAGLKSVACAAKPTWTESVREPFDSRRAPAVRRE